MNKTYIFTMEGAGASLKESPELVIKEKGVYLHFLRYGLFDRNSQEKKIETDYIPTIVKKILKVDENQKTETIEINEIKAVETIALKGVPSLENFHVARTVMNTGYIYLINDEPNKKDIFKELYVGEDGKLQYIIKEGKKNKKYSDLRTFPFDQEKLDYLIVKPNSRYWVAYSAVQWSYSYLLELISDQEKRKERMKLIICEGIKKDEEPPIHLNSIKDVSVCFHKDDSRFFIWERNLQHICADEKAQDKKGDNQVYEDMFITLDDPLGCAQDISEVVSEKTLSFHAYIQALQSGETFEEAFSRIKSGKFTAPNPEKEYGELFTLALTCYQMVYNDEQAILKYDGGNSGINFSDRHSLDPRPEVERYFSYTEKSEVAKVNRGYIGYGLDYQKIEGILGVKERKSIRESLISYRNDLGKFATKGTYFKLHLNDFLQNHWQRIFSGQNKLLDILGCLSYNPYNFEKHLLLRKDYNPKDQWASWFYELIDDEETSEQEDSLKHLLNLSVEIKEPLSTKVDVRDIANVYEKFIQYFCGAFVVERGKVFKSLEEKKKFIVKKLNTRVTNAQMFEIIDDDLILQLQKLGIEPDPKYIQMGTYRGKKQWVLRFLRESSPDGFSYEQRKPGQKTLKNAEISVRIRQDVTHSVPPKVAKAHLAMGEVVNSKAFNSVLAFLELYNFTNAITEVSKNETYKDEANAAAVAIKLGEATMDLVKTFLSTETIKKGFVAFPSTALTALGGIISVGWSMNDALSSMKKGDFDAALAMAGAGIAFGISTMATLGIGFSAAGPVGWVAALVAVGFMITASLLADTDIETFFKNFLLCDRKMLPKGAYQTPMDYTRYVLKNRAKLVTDKDYQQTMMNPIDAQATLFDMIVCKDILFTPIDEESESYTVHMMSSIVGFSNTSTTKTASFFEAKMIFSRFFSNPNNVEAYAFFYPEGIKKSEPIVAKVGEVSKINEKGITMLRVTFGVTEAYKKKITTRSELVFALRLRIQEAHSFYFPYLLHSKQRYLGAKIKLKTMSNSFYITSLKQHKEVKIDTLENLKTAKKW